MIGPLPHMEIALVETALGLGWSIAKAILVAAALILAGGLVIWRGRRS